MSNVIVQSAAASSSATSQAVTLSGAVTIGDLLIVAINFGNNVGTYGVTDGAGNTYTQFPNPATGLTGNDLTAFWAIANSNQSSLVITATNTGGGTHTFRVAAYEYSSTTGWQSSPVDQGNSANSAIGNTSFSAGSITPSAAGTLVFSAIQWGSVVSTISTSDGVGTNTYFEQPTSSGTGGHGWISDGRATSGDTENANGSATSCRFAWSGSSTVSAIVANFLPAAAPGSFGFEDDSFGVVSAAPDSNVSVW